MSRFAVCVFIGWLVPSALALQSNTVSDETNTSIEAQIESVISKRAASLNEFNAAFNSIYARQLSSIRPCTEQTIIPAIDEIKVCSDTLRNEGNAPFALFPSQPKALVVLFHGLSDSPYFLRSIATHLASKGYAVVAPLTPGHGKKEADADMQDESLQMRWYEHVDEIMDLANASHEKVFIGGFSTGGALATQFTLSNSEDVQGLLLFSGALQLSDSAETLSNIWGSKALAEWLDGDYQTQGPNPYKYPSVATYSALVLMDVIKDIRFQLDTLEQTPLKKPIFAAHSLADTTTLYEGVEDLLNKVDGDHTRFKIDEEFEVCHADLVVSAPQLIAMNFDKSQVNQSERCKVPQANPLHQNMLSVLVHFLDENV
ncbi:alpha/beta hydrolase [Ningiella sp. W23]|uniref:alpha/beta hydrolase n=1 Tax=Ningiella sp. W23 TaxID=3023715 RepID=UPI0037565C2F